MDRKHLEMLDERALEEYARIMGVATRGADGREGLMELLEGRRNRDVEVTVLGDVRVSIPAKRVRDQRLAEMNADGDNVTVAEWMRFVCGDDGYERIVEAATDDDGTVDSDAILLAFLQLRESEALKNALRG